jgi:hypothetical protein
MLTMKAWRLKLKLGRVCRSVVADSHHFDEDPDPHLTRIYVKSWLRICSKVMRNQNTTINAGIPGTV